MRLLDAGDPEPAIVEAAGAGAPFLFVCDHAGRLTPAKLNRLGLPESVFDLHIAWDIGAGALTRRLAEALGCGFVMQAYSRLVIDCNRAPDRPDAAPALSDGIRIPGNEGLTPQALAERVVEIHAPYHAAIARLLDARRVAGSEPVIVFVHSFTPRMDGRDRPWHMGVLHDGASRFSQAVLQHLSGLPGFVIGDNQPYAMDGVDYCAPLHAIGRGLEYLELEVRQDLIADETGVARIAAVVEGVLTRAAAQIGTISR